MGISHTKWLRKDNPIKKRYLPQDETEKVQTVKFQDKRSKVSSESKDYRNILLSLNIQGSTVPPKGTVCSSPNPCDCDFIWW